MNEGNEQWGEATIKIYQCNAGMVELHPVNDVMTPIL